MKIAINITREPLAGITTTNLSLLNNLHGSNISFVGVELNGYRSFLSPVVYRHLSPDWFNHHIVSICDFNINQIVKKSKSLADVQKEFKPIIDIVRGIFKKEKPAVVIVNGTYFIPWIIATAAKAEKIPIVLWYAGVLSREVTHMTPKFRKVFLDMEKSMIIKSSKIFFPSTICRDVVYKEVYGSLAVKNAEIIANPIAPLFTRATKYEESVQNRIAFVGRNAPIKNLKEFCSIHKKLLKLGWKHEATIVSNLKKHELTKIPKTIKVIPSMSPKDIKVFYATQGLIISPSIFETFGNVPIEAACIGIPVLVNESMGCTEVLIDSGLERMVINFDNKAAVLERIIELCGQHVLPKQINNLRKRVDTEYVANEMISVVQKVSGFTETPKNKTQTKIKTKPKPKPKPKLKLVQKNKSINLVSK